MEFSTMSINKFINELSSKAPTPGGGGGAALVGATGTALTGMVASLTIGNGKYEEYQDEIKEILKEIQEIQQAFLMEIENDAKVFNVVSSVYSMPKSSDDEKQARSEALQNALKNCVSPPMKMMELGEQALLLAKKSIGKTNVNVLSDLGVSAITLKSAIQSAWLNVIVNLNMIKDKEFADEYRKKGEGILNVSLPLADEIYEHVLKNI